MDSIPPAEEAGRAVPPDPSPDELSSAQDGVQVIVPPAALRERYEDLRQIGEGAMGAVFRGWDPKLSRAVAVKLLKSDAPEDTRRFLNEARAQARVQHDNVCRVYEAGKADGEPYIAMEFINGEPLDKAQATMSLEEKVKVIREVAAAVHEAHRLGLIHRDIKPGNIIVTTAEDGTRKPYVVDFGLAREVTSDAHVSATNSIVGTAAYMSPEQAQGDSKTLDRRSDVYSLGATLYELLAGRPPFVGANALLVMNQLLFDEAPSLSSIRRGIPADLETMVMKCLQRDPARRYESARAFGDDLQRFLDGEAIVAKRVPLSYVLWNKAKRNKALVTVAALGLFIALVLGGLWVHSAQQAAKQASLARELGEDVKYVELFLRSAYGLPVHDIEREQRVVRARLDNIQKRMLDAGQAGRGPGHYALGRGHLALHEYAQAEKQLELSLNAGYDRPEVHYSLGLALGGLYQAAADEARRIEDPNARDAALKEAEATYQGPALRHLRANRGTEVESKTYIEGLVAFHEKNYEVAAARAVAAADEAPWLYEAKKLEGDARFAAAVAAGETGKKVEARHLLNLAINAYSAAAAIATSDSSIHEAVAEAWIQLLNLDLWEGRPYRQTIDAAIAACDNAIASNPRSANAYTKKGRSYQRVGEAQLRAGEDPRPTLQLAIENASSARRLLPNDAFALDSIGNSFNGIAGYERKIGLDPQRSIEQALKSFDEATKIRPSFAWAWNDAGLTLMVAAEYRHNNGLDARQALDDAASRFTRASEVDPTYTSSYSNIAYALSTRAIYDAAYGRDPRADVKRAVESSLRATRIDPRWLPAINNRGWAELAGAQYEEATGQDPTAAIERTLSSFQTSLDINKDEADTHFGFGSALYVRALHQSRSGTDPTKAFDESRSSLLRAMELDAKEPAIRATFARLLMDMARRFPPLDSARRPLFEEAEKALAEGLRNNPRHAPLHTARAELHALLAEEAIAGKTSPDEEITKGLAQADEALAINPKKALALAAKGTLYALRARGARDAERQENERKAMEALEKALAINPNLPQRIKNTLALLRGASSSR